MALSADSIAVVKSTTPVLWEHGLEIASRMYEIMFDRYPEIKPMFAGSPDNQSYKLSSAIIAFSQSVDKLEDLDDALKKIVYAHVDSNVSAEHYPVVAECLMESLHDVLGDAFTPELKHAWGEAYQVLADVLIEAETALYVERKSA